MWGKIFGPFFNNPRIPARSRTLTCLQTEQSPTEVLLQGLLFPFDSPARQVRQVI